MKMIYENLIFLFIGTFQNNLRPKVSLSVFFQHLPFLAELLLSCFIYLFF